MSKQDWDLFWQNQKLSGEEANIFEELFNRTLKGLGGKSVLEVGCAGGLNLLYLMEHYGLLPAGVDFSDGIECTTEAFESKGLPKPELYKADIFKWNSNRKFDVVCSFGFVEHFMDFKKILECHVEHLKPGGLLLVTLPNFGNMQYLFHLFIDYPNLKLHNTKIMNLKVIRDTLKQLPLNVEFLGYYRTFGFWCDKQSWFNLKVSRLLWLFGSGLIKIFGVNFPNPLFSAYIVFAAKKEN